MGISLFSARTLALVVWYFCLVLSADAREHRSSALRLRFLHSLGLTHTPVGCQVDHFAKPLHCGGKDEMSNLRLICGEYKKEKETAERNCTTLPAWLQAHPCQYPSCQPAQ